MNGDSCPVNAGALLIVGEASNGLMALQQIEQLLPDVAVLDIDLPRLNGFELVKAIAIRFRRLLSSSKSSHVDGAQPGCLLALWLDTFLT